MLDLDAYFRRIDYCGPVAPSLETLAALMHAHVCAVPFENLDVLLARPIDLTLDAIADKIITRQRGGYCFEQNSLFFEVLRELGFDVTPLSARVRYQRPRDVTPPRTHLFLKVIIDGTPWAADVGIGNLSLTSPIRLDLEGTEQPTAHEPRRIVPVDGRLFHQARLGDEWHDVLEFTGETMPPIDREVANWFTSTHPQSHFRARLVAARGLSGGQRVTLVNRELAHRDRSGRTVVATVTSPQELLVVLRDRFGLAFPEGTEFPCVGLDWS
jgi:N-hydroxyarylamine O-acetyltransferase